MRRVAQVAIDTSSGWNYQIAKCLLKSPSNVKQLDAVCNIGEGAIKTTIRNLRKMEAIEVAPGSKARARMQPKHRLTKEVAACVREADRLANYKPRKRK